MALTPARVGMAYRPALASWVGSRPTGVECLEVAAEGFYKAGEKLLRHLAERFPLLVHSSSLSLGTPGPIAPQELSCLAAVVAVADPLWVSDHLAFSRTAEVDLGWPVPVVPGPDSLAVLVEHARAIQERLGRPFLVENIAHFLTFGVHSEVELLNALSRDAGSGILLDLTALVVNARNHGSDPRHWLSELALEHVVQLHVGGCSLEGERWHDSHRSPVADEVLELAAEVLRTAPVRAVILEYDGRYPPRARLEAELDRLKALAAAAASGADAAGGPAAVHEPRRHA